MVIVIDTREQRPWSFPPHITTEIGTLRTGDYAIKGDDRFAIERKSADDFVGTISLGWCRFVKELNRMDAQFDAKVVIVETDFETFCFRTGSGIILPPDHEHTRCTPQFVMKRIAELTMRNVSVLFAGNAELASAIALRIFIERQTKLDIASSTSQVVRESPSIPSIPSIPSTPIVRVRIGSRSQLETSNLKLATSKE